MVIIKREILDLCKLSNLQKEHNSGEPNIEVVTELLSNAHNIGETDFGDLP